MLPVALDLPGPSRRVVIEPLRLPNVAPEPAPRREEPPPEREPVREEPAEPVRA